MRRIEEASRNSVEPPSSKRSPSAKGRGSTWAKSTAAASPWGLALVITRGKGAASHRAAAAGAAVQRTPVQPSRAQSSRPAGTPGRTRVRGPGQ